MCCFEEALQNCTGMMDPYGDMPLAGGMTASAEIDIMDMENGVHVSVVKTPPRDGRIRLSEVIESIMGPYMASPCVADQGKCNGTDTQKSVPQKEESDTDGQKDGKMNNRKPSAPLDDAKPGDKPEESTAAPAGKDDKDSWRKEKK